MKYIVMECHLSYAIVLSEEGQFIKVANMGYSVGQTVIGIIPMKEPDELEEYGQIDTNNPHNTVKTSKGSNKTPRKNKLLFKLMATAACFVLIFASVLQFTNNAYASVLLTINPEVRIDVDKHDKVIKLDGINPDGDVIIKDYIYKGKDLQIVTDELLDKAIEAGYLSDGATITIALDSKDNTWIVNKSDSLLNSTNYHLSEKVSVTITVMGNGIQTHSLETKSSFVTDYDEINDVLEQSSSNYNSTDYGDTDYINATYPSSSDYNDNSSNYNDNNNDDVDDDSYASDYFDDADVSSSNYINNVSNYDSEAYTNSSESDKDDIDDNNDNNDDNDDNNPDNTSSSIQDSVSSSNYSNDNSDNSDNSDASDGSSYSDDSSNSSGNSNYSDDSSNSSSNSGYSDQD